MKVYGVINDPAVANPDWIASKVLDGPLRELPDVVEGSLNTHNLYVYQAITDSLFRRIGGYLSYNDVDAMLACIERIRGVLQRFKMAHIQPELQQAVSGLYQILRLADNVWAQRLPDDQRTFLAEQEGAQCVLNVLTHGAARKLVLHQWIQQSQESGGQGSDEGSTRLMYKLEQFGLIRPLSPAGDSYEITQRRALYVSVMERE